MTLAGAVRDYIERARPSMPHGVELDYWRDRSVIIEKRLSTLGWNALQGGALVLLLLGLFLRPRIAFWITMGIPVSFLGALFCLPWLGVTINIMSVFAFILVLGIVVDDAIVTGENIYTHLRRGSPGVQAAIEGTQEVSVPVVFGVLTTVIAFLPVMLIGGRRGPIFAQIPLIVIPVLLFSLIESKLILPSHLKHVRVHGEGGGPLARLQAFVATVLERGIRRLYSPVLRLAMGQRYLTAAAETLRKRHVDPQSGEPVVRHILATVGSAGGTQGQSHVGRVMFEIVPPEQRTLQVTSTQLVTEWRKLIGPIAGAREVSYRAEIGRTSNPIEVQLSGHDLELLRELSGKLKKRLATHPGVFDIADSFDQGKLELLLKLKPQAELLGLDLEHLARQVRQGFFGAEAQRIQRGRDDLRVMVRYPLEQRRSLGDLEQVRVRTSAGRELPFGAVASVRLDRGLSSITRIDRKRTITVTADIDKEQADARAINENLRGQLERLVALHPGVKYEMAGEAKEQRESFGAMAPTWRSCCSGSTPCSRSRSRTTCSRCS